MSLKQAKSWKTNSLSWSLVLGVLLCVCTLASAQPPPPRFAYVANGASQNISAYTVDATFGALTEIDGSPFPAQLAPLSVAVHPTGQFAYVAGPSSINGVSAYRIDAASGALMAIANYPAGRNPNFVAVDPSGNFAYVANSFSNNISGYTIDDTGALTEMPDSPFATGTSPAGIATAVKMTVTFLYVANTFSDNVSGYSIDGTTGALTPVPGSPFPFPPGSLPFSVAVHPTGQFAYVSYGSFQGNVRAFTIAEDGALTPVSEPVPAGMYPLSVTVDRRANSFMSRITSPTPSQHIPSTLKPVP